MRRIIARSSHPDHSERWFIDQISAEIQLIKSALLEHTDSLPADFWAEELICRCEEAAYQVRSGDTEFFRTPVSGREIIFRGDLRKNKVEVSFSNQAAEHTNRSGLNKMWAEKLDQSKDILKSGGWEIHNNTKYSGRTINLYADIDVADLRNNLLKALNALKKGIDNVRLE